LRSQCQHGGDLGKLLSPERPLCRQAAGRERLAASSCLAPTLTQRYRHDRQPAGAQRCRRSRIGARGATIRYLPKYSPDLNRSRCLSANSGPICARPPRLRRRICRYAATLAERFRFAPYRRFRSSLGTTPVPLLVCFGSLVRALPSETLDRAKFPEPNKLFSLALKQSLTKKSDLIFWDEWARLDTNKQPDHSMYDCPAENSEEDDPDRGGETFGHEQRPWQLIVLWTRSELKPGHTAP
jgi:hypothetical protein